MKRELVSLFAAAAILAGVGAAWSAMVVGTDGGEPAAPTAYQGGATNATLVREGWEARGLAVFPILTDLSLLEEVADARSSLVVLYARATPLGPAEEVALDGWLARGGAV